LCSVAQYAGELSSYFAFGSDQHAALEEQQLKRIMPLLLFYATVPDPEVSSSFARLCLGLLDPDFAKRPEAPSPVANRILARVRADLSLKDPFVRLRDAITSSVRFVPKS
jgi:hypothetical protein